MRSIVIVIWLFTCSGLLAQEGKWKSLLADVDVNGDGKGVWSKNDQGLRVKAEEAARLTIPGTLPAEYDLRVVFTRESGQHSIAIFFPHGANVGAFEVDAWGQHLAGVQNLDGRDLRENGTKKEGITLRNGTKYTLLLQVRSERVVGMLDNSEIVNVTTDGSDLSVPDVWQFSGNQQLGVGAWQANTIFHSIDIKRVEGKPLATTEPTKNVVPTPEKGMTRDKDAAAKERTNKGKRKVLIVIANQDFFYREYAEPREELERAGFEVVVAAGRKAPCRPHQGSGEGADGGVVNPDLALADVKSADYETILFSGGWGASMYQFAFRGRYDNPVYNGNAKTKEEVNRIINEFIADEKYVCALCNAVSVLAWARVDDKSPLAGKRVCAPTRQAASGIYNGRQAQPSCRWHPEANGAILSPAGSIGNPNSAHDDVLVDGKIVTGEDDPSAREMGRQIVKLLSETN